MFLGGILDLGIFGAFGDPHHGAAVRANVGFNVAFGFQPLQGGGELTPTGAFGLARGHNPAGTSGATNCTASASSLIVAARINPLHRRYSFRQAAMYDLMASHRSGE